MSHLHNHSCFCCTHSCHHCRDDCGRLALHWSAELGLTEVCKGLLEATSAAAAALTARVAAASADPEQGEQPPELELPNLLDMQVCCVVRWPAVSLNNSLCSCVAITHTVAWGACRAAGHTL